MEEGPCKGTESSLSNRRKAESTGSEITSAQKWCRGLWEFCSDCLVVSVKAHIRELMASEDGEG